MKVVSLQYTYDFPTGFEAYEEKITTLVKSHADKDLLLFPEYAGLEMLSFAPLEKLLEYCNRYVDLFIKLSHQYKLYVCAGTHVLETEKGKF